MGRTEKIRYFFSGVVVALLVAVMMNPTVAATASKQLTAYYNNIKIVLNGELITPKDASGNVVEPFIVDGTTYLPVRTLCRALGLEMDYDSATATVYAGEKPATPVPTTAAVETKQFSGHLDTRDSINTYDFTLPYASRVTIDFEHGFVDSGSNLWKIQFIAKESGILFDFYAKGNALKTSSSHAAYLPSGEYIVRIAPYSYYSYNNASYVAQVNFQKNTGDFETEENGAQETANSINVGDAIGGNTLTSQDVDYYKLIVATKMDMTIDFVHDFIDSSSNYWSVQLISANGASVLSYNVKGNTLKTVSNTVTLEPGEYYLRIAPYFSYSYSNIDYTVTVNKK